MVKESEDEIISKRKFQKGSGVDLGSFLIDSEPKTDVPVENLEIEDNSKEEVDIAIGEIAEIFTRGDAPSRINRDGTVDEPPEIDSVTEYAIEGEKRIHFGLMISMIVVWSAIGAIVGTTLGPTLSAIGLLAMAGFGIWLGEVWIPKNSMHILGVTWVIISMKLLYGLAISMYSWDWITQTELGVGLLGLVTVNIFIASVPPADTCLTRGVIGEQ